MLLFQLLSLHELNIIKQAAEELKLMQVPKPPSEGTDIKSTKGLTSLVPYDDEDGKVCSLFKFTMHVDAGNLLCQLSECM